MTGTLGNRSDDAINDRRPPERAPPTSFHRATYGSLGMVRPEAVVMAPRLWRQPLGVQRRLPSS